MMTEEWRLKTEGIKLRKEGKREHLKDQDKSDEKTGRGLGAKKKE